MREYYTQHSVIYVFIRHIKKNVVDVNVLNWGKEQKYKITTTTKKEKEKNVSPH